MNRVRRKLVRSMRVMRPSVNGLNVSDQKHIVSKRWWQWLKGENRLEQKILLLSSLLSSTVGHHLRPIGTK